MASRFIESCYRGSLTPKITFFHSHSVWGSVAVSQCVCMSRCLCQTAICPTGAVWRHLIGQSAWIERGLMGRVMCRTALRHTNTHCQLKCDSLRHTKTKELSWRCRNSPCTNPKKQQKKNTYFAQRSSITVAV